MSIAKKMWPLCREGPSAKAPLPSAPGNYARQLWKNFPSSGVPSVAERSCTGRSAKNFFKKIKNSLCGRPLPGTLGTGFSQKK
jgi:hypothetical protein